MGGDLAPNLGGDEKMLNVVYDHFLTRKPPFFTLFIPSRTSDSTTSQNIGGTNAWAVPPPQIFWGGPSPQSPLGLRPCPEGRKRKERPRKNWTETVKDDLRGLEISWERAEELAMDRVECRKCVSRCTEMHKMD